MTDGNGTIDASIIILRGLGWEHEEIAEALGISKKTLATRRSALRELSRTEDPQKLVLRTIFFARPGLFGTFSDMRGAMQYLGGRVSLDLPHDRVNDGYDLDDNITGIDDDLYYAQGATGNSSPVSMHVEPATPSSPKKTPTKKKPKKGKK